MILLKMIWDSLAPIALIVIGICVMLALRNWSKVRRVHGVLRRLPAEIRTEIRAAWDGRPSPRTQHIETPTNHAADTGPAPTHSRGSIRLDKVPGGGKALLEPPSLQHTLEYMKHCDDGRYLFPYGWFLKEGQSTATADLAFADLTETFNIGVIGPQQYGKTSLVFAAFMALTFQRSPRELQFAIFDLKDIDFSEMDGSAYTHMMVRRPDQIAGAVKALQEEIDRRGAFLRRLRLSNWKNYTGKDLPMLVVYISELSTMVATLGNVSTVDKFLNDLMGRGAAFGIRTIVDTHSLAGYSTLWRNLLSDRILGPGLSNPQHDQVNGDIPTAAIVAAGAVPPSQLRKTHLGVFTVTTDAGQSITLRMVYVPDDIRQVWLDRLPKKRVMNDVVLTDEELVGEQHAESMLTGELPSTILAGSAAELYQQGIELNVILAQPQVRKELRDLAASNRHAKTNTPNIRQITIRLFDVDAPSGTQQPMVKTTLIEMGLVEEKPITDMQIADQSAHAMAA